MAKHKDAPARRIWRHWGRTGRASCPPHGPIVVDAFEGVYHVASCLACGLSGPEREGTLEAKAAFDESIR